MNGRTGLSGVVVAGATALTSGVSVFVNSYGVHAVRDATVYTTIKNLVAALVLGSVLWLVHAFGNDRDVTTTHGNGHPPGASSGGPGLLRWAGLAYVGVVGGGIAFVLFFEGLARTSAEPAAFLHDTLVIWVALLAVPFLRERLSPWNVGAIVLLVCGQVVISGGIGHLVAGDGQLLVLSATLLWAVETVIAKALLRSISPARLGGIRMGVGAAVLVGFTAVTGRFGELTSLNAGQVGWALLTGALLALYVGTWMVALSRARAVDVTSVLVGSVVVTTLLQLAAGHSESVPEVVGLVLVLIGAATVVRAWPRLARAT